MNRRKVLVIGLDCVPPELIFKRFRKEMPNVQRMIESGMHGRLRSSIPPSSTNAWTSMAMSKGSDSIGVYDYVYRKNRSYTDLGVISSVFSHGCVWDILSELEKKVVVFNVPMTYPPRKVRGAMISDVGFTPSEKSDYTYPKELRDEIEKNIGKYAIKIPDARKLEKPKLLEEIFRISEVRFRAFEYLLENVEWDFFIGVLYATDALMHNFWRYLDPGHRKHEKDEKMLERIGEYFRYVDGKIGEMISKAGEDTTVILMSDHGAKRMNGRINLNDWLIKEGYLVLKSKTKEKTPLLMADVDWEKTKAFAFGAYYASLFLNVKGRDPEGCVEPGKEYRKLKREIKSRLKKIPDDRGNKINTKVYDIPESENAPDLLVYFDDLHWGVNSRVKNGTLYSWSTEKGPDDAVHSQTGFFVISGKGVKKSGNPVLKDIRDITPTILNLMKIPIPRELEGKAINV